MTFKLAKAFEELSNVICCDSETVIDDYGIEILQILIIGEVNIDAATWAEFERILDQVDKNLNATQDVTFKIPR